MSQATLYRLFPGGRDIIFEARRVYELDQFFTTLLEQISGASTLEDLLVRTVTVATRELRNDEHTRLVISDFLAPSDLVDLADPMRATRPRRRQRPLPVTDVSALTVGKTRAASLRSAVEHLSDGGRCSRYEPQQHQSGCPQTGWLTCPK